MIPWEFAKLLCLVPCVGMVAKVVVARARVRARARVCVCVCVVAVARTRAFIVLYASGWLASGST